MKRKKKTLKVGKNWMKFDCFFSMHLEKCCEMVGIPAETDIEEILNHFKIKGITAIDEADGQIICETPQDRVTMIFLNSITFRERGEIWIEDKMGCKKYVVVPETEEVIKTKGASEAVEVPWYTIYLGSNVSVGNKSLLTHIDETITGKSTGRWIIKQNKHEILEVYVETFGGHEIYHRAQAIEDCLIPYLQEGAELDASDIYCWIMNALKPGKNLEESDQKEIDSEENEAEEDIDKLISVTITVWDGKQNKKSEVFKGIGDLNEFMIISGEKKIEYYLDGTYIWQSGKEKVFRAGTACVGNRYGITMDINANEIQNVGKHATELIEQAERAANNYISLFK